jgi:hypothetical protein
VIAEAGKLLELILAETAENKGFSETASGLAAISEAQRLRGKRVSRVDNIPALYNLSMVRF